MPRRRGSSPVLGLHIFHAVTKDKCPRASRMHQEANKQEYRKLIHLARVPKLCSVSTVFGNMCAIVRETKPSSLHGLRFPSLRCRLLPCPGVPCDSTCTQAPPHGKNCNAPCIQAVFMEIFARVHELVAILAMRRRLGTRTIARNSRTGQYDV